MCRISTCWRSFLVSILFLSGIASAEDIHDRSDDARRRELENTATINRMVMMPMRDGVRLATRIYLPKSAQGKVPTVFWRTPYNFSERLPGNSERPSAYLYFALQAIRHGYAFVIQNERGRYFSEGEWKILGFPRTDGSDALSWIAEQPWSNGKVATVGCSSTAEWQLALASTGHPAHAAAIPMAYGAGIGRMGQFYEQGNMYRGGAIQQSMIEWMFEYQNTQRPMFPSDTSREDLIRLARYTDLEIHPPPTPDWKEAFRHLPMSEMFQAYGGPKGDWNSMGSLGPEAPAWYQGGLFHDGQPYHVPTLWVNSWYDLSTAPNLETFNYARTHGEPGIREHQYLIVAPTVHCAIYRLQTPLVVGARSMGDVRFGFQDIVWSFLDFYTKQAPNQFASKHPKVKYFAMGANRWVDTDAWPPAGFIRQRMYLNSQHSANTLRGDGTLAKKRPSPGDTNPFDEFTYNPDDPVPSLGGNLWGATAGAFDNREIEARQDVLVYSTRPFEHDTEVTGQITIKLFVGSDAKDTDFTVKLLDVLPDGTAYNLDETIQRARYRDGYDKQVWMQADEVYALNMSPITTSNVFLKGHKLRIEVSSSNFPRFQRNLNLGTNNFTEHRMTKAQNRVYHSPDYASFLELPMRVVPE